MKTAELGRAGSLTKRFEGLDEELDPCVVLSPRMDLVYLNVAARNILPASWLNRPCWQTFPVVEQIYGTGSSVARSIRKSCESLFCLERIVTNGRRQDYGVAIVPLPSNGHQVADALLMLRRKEDKVDVAFESHLISDAEQIRNNLMPWIASKNATKIGTMTEPRKRDGVLGFLREDSLFKTVSDPSLHKLSELGRIRSVQRGNFLYSMGQPATELYFLMEGMAHIILLEKDGRERILYSAGPGDMVGAIAFFDQEPYPCTLRVEQDSKFIVFRRAPLLALLQEESELLIKILGGLIHRQRQMVQLLEEMTFVGTSGRLWNYLVQNSAGERDQFPRILTRLPTREKVAGAIGTVREVVSRGLSRLVSSGHISIDGRQLTIHKPL